MRRVFVVLLGLVVVVGCAPISLNRTAQPTPAGKASLTLYGTYAFPMVANPQVICNVECYVQTFLPREVPPNATFSFGVDGTTEVNFSVGYNGARLGGKSLLVNGPVMLAIDYGAFVTTAIGVDAGLILSVPLEGTEPYFALRGYAAHFWFLSARDFLEGSATLGVRVPLGWTSLFAELTVMTQHFYGDGPGDGLLGWALVPSIAFRF